MPGYAVFFRGLNIGQRRIAMADLKSFLAELGGTDVTTILQSGSAVLLHSSPTPEFLENLIEPAFAVRFGYTSDTHVRTLDDLESSVAANPFPEFASDRPNHLLVSFGKTAFDQTSVHVVQSAVTGPERLAAVGKELFVMFPDGIGPSTLPKVKGYDRLVGRATARNWSTTLKVLEALRGLQ